MRGRSLARVIPTVMVMLLAPIDSAPSTGTASPNVVLILADDLGWSQTAVPMDPRIDESRSAWLATPSIDRLAREGVRFTSGYAPSPSCTPSRRSILSGTSTARSLSAPGKEWALTDRLTIPRAFSQVNPDYRSAHFGKWGGKLVSTPAECGFDVSDGVTTNFTGGMPRPVGVEAPDPFDGSAHFLDNVDPKRTMSVVANAIEFIREQAAEEKPFYVQVSYYAVHLAVVCREETLKKWQTKGAPDRAYTRAWAAMLEEMDAGVGRILDVLDDLGIADQTYVFFTSDNGGHGHVPGGDPSLPPPNFPLTGAKHHLSEGGIRVPFLVRGPGIEPGSTCHTPVVGYDLLPTFFELAGGRGRLGDEIDGVSILPLLFDPEDGAVQRPGGAIFFHREFGGSAVRQGPYKLVLGRSRDGELTSRTLYRLDEDPREDGREIESEPETAGRLESLLLTHLESIREEVSREEASREEPSPSRSGR